MKGDGLMTSKDGGAVKVDVAKTSHTLFSLPALSIEETEKIDRINMYVDTTGNAELGNGVVASTFQVTSAMKFTEDTVAFFTPSGHKINIDGAAQSATITMNGATYPIDDEEHGDEVPSRRRRLRRGRQPSVETTGTFSMSIMGGAAGGVGRRELQ